ncbi:hypothetical protein EXT46_04880 [Pseudoalteromonas sp. CO325X]|uniref:ChaN family lipoprotein n=1 Tax=Pseudoalteromonas sp. CO325X TaxID=1777262 RepID=UPI00102311AB|nr:ChaN family lipoprotein [Pseudoalteromonas sp. CO325X]RZF83632.1 hypothetical protein EXT46_04880 [Pseudoalteromonas sp. CO325X]
MNKINKDVDYKKMAGSARLILLAESSHNPASFKYEAIRALKQLRQAGFTHFAMEMLSHDMHERLTYFQKTGKGFESIKNHFKTNWDWGHGVANGYSQLAQHAHKLGMKLVALDVPAHIITLMEQECSDKKIKAEVCDDAHQVRNDVWANLIASLLEDSSKNKVIAFMHRFHAIRAGKYREGLDTLMITRGVHNIRLIEYIGGLSCYLPKQCQGWSDEDAPLNQLYFSREGSDFDTPLKSFQVHIPERRVAEDGALSW